MQRLEQRWQWRMANRADSSSASDGRPDLYDAQQASWQTFAPDEEPEVHYIPVDATLSISTMVEQIIEELHMRRV